MVHVRSRGSVSGTSGGDSDLCQIRYLLLFKPPVSKVTPGCGVRSITRFIGNSGSGSVSSGGSDSGLCQIRYLPLGG